MPELTVDPNYVEMLAVKVRGLFGKEPTDEEDASNAVDDDGADLLHEAPGDLTRAEIEAEIRGLSPEERSELIALMWLGRGDGEEEEWPELLAQAKEAPSNGAVATLLDEPLVADFWDEALERLGLRSGADDVDEI